MTSTAIWQPKQPKKTQMWQFMDHVNRQFNLTLRDYHQLYQWSIEEAASFWSSLCQFYQIEFNTPPQTILNHYQTMFEAQWFSGARFNFAEQLLRRQDEHPALVSILEDGRREVLSYAGLRREVAACAAGLRKIGLKAGDRVAAIMPNVSMTIIAMLATTSLGAIWSSCSPDFGAQAAHDRLGQIDPTVLFICDGHQYMGKTHLAHEKITMAQTEISSLRQIVICPILGQPLHLENQDKLISWQDFLQQQAKLEFHPQSFDHPVYILYSSGTTGKPKCIVHGAGGTLLQHIKELGLHCDLGPEDNLCFYTTCGWMMWNWMVSALALGATLTLYEGAPSWPDNQRLFQLIEDEKITVFGTSAKFLSALEKAGLEPNQVCDLFSLRLLLSTGSPLLPANYDFVYRSIKKEMQLSSISGGTDIISCFALGNPILPVYRGELQCRGLGMAVEIFNEEGRPVICERGELVCSKPFPSMPVGFWNDPDKSRYHHAYFEHFPEIWTHGDFAELTEHGGLIIYGRSDAVLNPGGVRIGTAEIYRQVEKIPEVTESLVIGQNWDNDVRVVLFVKLQEGLQLDKALEDKIRHLIKTQASPRHVPAKILQVGDIPRTISGKIVELAVRQIVHGEAIQNLQSLANPEALAHFKNREELKH